MSFKSWYKEEDHDLYNYPEEAMQEAYNAAIDEDKKEIAALTEVIDKLRNQYNAAVLVNTKQADEIKDLQNRYAESSMLFQGDIKKLAENLFCAGEVIKNTNSNIGENYKALASEYVGG